MRDPTEVIWGVRIGPKSLPQLIDESLQAVDSGSRRADPYFFACANPHSLVVARRDRQFLAALGHASAVVADGVGVTTMARVLNVDVGPRITGSDYFSGLMSALNRRGTARVAFFGSTPDVLRRLAERICALYPQVEIVGLISPAFGDWSRDQSIYYLRAINALKPDVLWVGMTAPRQEKWIQANSGLLDVKVVAAVGAVFDYVAGTVTRAPRWAQSAGLEWAYRLAREPRRVWRRYLVSGPAFVAASLFAGRRVAGRATSSDYH